jgi:transcriptional regulator GlxA family with amidase domain
MYDMKKAVIVAFDQFTDIDIFLAWDLLNRVRFRDKEFQVKIVGTKTSHKSICGIDLATHGFVEECADADLVFFGSGTATRTLIKDKAYLERFNLDPDRQIICSMCSGALLIAALGHLKGLSAITYPTVYELLRSFDVDVLEDKHLVTHGNIGTAAGCLAAVDLIGWAIEKLYDEKVREDVIASVLPVGQGQACIY